jgi:hypothetical protein
MNNFQEIANFVWSIADEVLRDDIKGLLNNNMYNNGESKVS